MGKRIQASATTKTVKATKKLASSFGKHLASLRKAANLLPQIAAALGVSIDELFGVDTRRRLVKQDGLSRLRRRLLAIEKLESVDKRQVLQLIDAFIEPGQLKRKVESRA